MIKSTSPFSEEFGPGHLFVGTHHKTEPPASLVRFSLDDGSFEAFFHKGIMQEMAAWDIDGDGREELLLTGYNIALNANVIVVLDPGNVEGSSPRGACYALTGMETDIAKYYVKLPPYHRFERYVSRVWPLHTRIMKNDDSLRVRVKSRTEEVLFTIEDGMTFTGAEIVKVVRSSSGRVDSLTYLDFPEEKDDEKALLEGIRYWNGENWVAEPTVNRSYLKHLAGKNK